MTTPRRPLTHPVSPLTQDAITAMIEAVNEAAETANRKWGYDRLRLVVPPEWRAKFDRQRVLFNSSVWGIHDGEQAHLAAVQSTGEAMIRAYAKLDALATGAGVQPLGVKALEVRLNDGTVAAIVATNAEAHEIIREGRAMQVFTLEEFRSVVDGLPDMVQALHRSEGVKVADVRIPLPIPPGVWGQHGEGEAIPF